MTKTAEATSEKETPGHALRRVRILNRWTLADVSARTGLPVSTLSKIENDKVSLSYDKLSRLSQGLGIDIAELFSPQPAAQAPAPLTGRRSFTPAGQGKLIETPNFRHLYPAADLLNKQFVPIIAEVRARSLEDFGAMIRHAGEEYVYVLEGSVEIHTELYAPTRMEVGDSIYFDSGMAHAYVAVSPGPCRLLSICSASEAQIAEVVGGSAAAAPRRR